MVKSNVAIVGPRVRFSAGADDCFTFLLLFETRLLDYFMGDAQVEVQVGSLGRINAETRILNLLSRRNLISN